MTRMVAVAVMACLGAVSSRAEEEKKPVLAGPVLLEMGHTEMGLFRNKWQIKPTGEYERAERLVPRVTSYRTSYKTSTTLETARNKLTEAQLKALAAHFTAMEFEKLPNNLGLPAEELLSEERRYFVRLTYGKKRVVLISKKEDMSDVLPAETKGGSEAASDREAKPTRADWSRFVALTLVVKGALPGKSAVGVPSAPPGTEEPRETAPPSASLPAPPSGE
jgi:hypothetical protein